MNKMKKLLAILVAFVMCFTVFGMVASATDVQDTEVYLKLNFADNAATQVNANISTSIPCGAIQGTITYSGVKFNSASFIEDGNSDDKFVHDEASKTIKFVAVTDKLDTGDTNWANFKFTITGDATFTLKDVSVCDVGATDIKNGINLDPENIKVDTTIRALGAQFRKESENVKAALRFGADLKRNKNDSSITEGTAVSCGYLIGFDFNIAAKNNGAKDALTTYVNLENGELVATSNSGVFVKKSKYYFTSTDTNLIYTYAVTGFYDGDTPVERDGHVLANENISAVPYVIYKDANDDYQVKYGEEISRSYTEVKDTYDNLKAN